VAFVWAITSLAVLLIISDISYRQFASRRICRLFENVPLFGAVTSNQSTSAETLSIPVNSQCSLKACLHRPAADVSGLVVFCPELHGDRWTALNYCRALLDAGFYVLAFEFRNHDDDLLQIDTPSHWVTETEIDDIAAVLKFVLTDPDLADLPLGLFGVSRGGAAAIVAACRYPQIQSIVTDGAYSTMGMLRSFISRFSRYVVPDWFFNRLPKWHVELTLRQAVRRSERKWGCRYVHLEREPLEFQQPILLVSGARDSYVTPEVTRHLAKCLNAEGHAWTVERAKHNRSRDVATREYDRRIVDHFQRTLCPSAELTEPSSVQPRPSVA